jgi:hypothetical protein
MSRRLGLDGWAIGIHVFVTITIVAAFSSSGASGQETELGIPLMLGASALLFDWRRRRALAAAPQQGLTTGEVQLERMDEIEARMSEVEMLHARVAELEERLDFSERLLVQQQEPRHLVGGNDASN